MQFLQSGKSCASIINPAGLGQYQFESLLNGFTAEADGFRVAARLVMSTLP
jgi:hypothetical protein